MEPFLEMLTLVLAQSAEDARRFVAIGVPEERVRVGGNLKFDTRSPRSATLVDQLRTQLPKGAKVLVAGSTLEDEERVLMEAWPAICARHRTRCWCWRRGIRSALHELRPWRGKKGAVVQRSVWDEAPWVQAVCSCWIRLVNWAACMSWRRWRLWVEAWCRREDTIRWSRRDLRCR